VAFHVRDKKVDFKVRELAREEGVGITRAIEIAVEDRLEKKKPSFREYVKAAQARLAAVRRPITDGMTEKEFSDWINGEDQFHDD